MFNFFILFSVLFPNFNEARQATMDNGKPLMVIVSGDGCAPCAILKEQIIKPMDQAGELNEVNHVIVNQNKEDRALINSLKGNRNSIPQTILFYKKDNKWFKATLVGIDGRGNSFTREKVKELIKLGVK